MQNEPKPGEILLLDKPIGWSSFQALKKLKYTIKAKKAGHAGTLDPLATGLLIVCTERSTKKISVIQNQEKTYTGTIFLGAATASGDLEEEINERAEISHITEEQIHKETLNFLGDVEQIPPAFSAIKINGQRAYALARSGQEVEMKKRVIHIYDFKITRVAMPEIDFEVRCSKGTYIRTLGMDFARALGTVGHLTALRRTKIGEYNVSDAKTIEQWVAWANS
jgi:tRNA pseudouridine55 synthase